MNTLLLVSIAKPNGFRKRTFVPTPSANCVVVETVLPPAIAETTGSWPGNNVVGQTHVYTHADNQT